MLFDLLYRDSHFREPLSVIVEISSAFSLITPIDTSVLCGGSLRVPEVALCDPLAAL
jgi:hypothetical protein